MENYSIKIYGAGMAGLLAASILSKDYDDITIYEAKADLSPNHHALLRFKENTIEEYTGILCKKVEIYKNIFYKGKLFNKSNILFDNLYSLKVSGKISTRSISDLSAGIRYIPPSNFYEQLVSKNAHKIIVNHKLKEFSADNSIKISTIPLSAMYSCVCSKKIDFEYEQILVVKWDIPESQVYQTIYFPENTPDVPAYRISLLGSQLICEIPNAFVENNGDFNEIGLIDQIENSFGLNLDNRPFTKNIQRFGKILDIDEDVRQNLLYELTVKYNVYSLGKFACWRNHTMLNDVVKDTLKIKKWIKQRNVSNYEKQKAL